MASENLLLNGSFEGKHIGHQVEGWATTNCRERPLDSDAVVKIIEDPDDLTSPFLRIEAKTNACKLVVQSVAADPSWTNVWLRLRIRASVRESALNWHGVLAVAEWDDPSGNRKKLADSPQVVTNGEWQFFQKRFPLNNATNINVLLGFLSGYGFADFDEIALMPNEDLGAEQW